VLGIKFRVSDLVRMLAVPAGALVPSVLEAVVTGFVRDDGDHRVFRHDLIRDALYYSLPAPLRRAMHLDAARALRSGGATPDGVAEHLVRAAERGDPTVIAWLREIAGQQAVRAPGSAAELLARALELTESSDPTRDEILAEQAATLIWSGRVVEGEEMCRKALARPQRPNIEAALRVGLTLALAARGRMADALQEVDAAAASATLSTGERARLWGWAAAIHVVIGDLEGALAAANRAEDLAGEAGEDLAQCVALCVRGATLGYRGDAEGAVSLSEQAVRLAERPSSVAVRYVPHVYQALALADLDRLEEARAVILRGRHLSEQHGTKWNLPFYQWSLMLVHFFSGMWDDALAEYDTGVELVEETGTRHGVLAYTLHAMIAFYRNDLNAAEGMVRAAEEELQATGVQWRIGWTERARALLLDATGRTPEALESLAAAWQDCVDRQIASEFVELGPELVRLARRTGDHGLVRCVTDRVIGKSYDAGIPMRTAAGRVCLGLATSDPEELLHAVRIYRTTNRPLELGLACHDASSLLAEHGREQEAVVLAREALRTFSGLGASRGILLAQAHLRMLGVKAGARGTRNRPKTGWGSLTDTERQVVALVADGLSNPQIADRLYLSRRTVQTHVSHALAKLNCRSRAGLAALAARRPREASGGHAQETDLRPVPGARNTRALT
jgi:DNA-binding CsgD family transcriptional regulator